MNLSEIHIFALKMHGVQLCHFVLACSYFRDLCMHFTLAMKTGGQVESREIIVVGLKIGPNTRKQVVYVHVDILSAADMTNA